MFSILRRHINPTTILALAALVFAVTGVSFAATGAGKGNRGTDKTHSLSALASAGGRGPIAAIAKSKAKSKGKSGPRGAKGPAGPAGKNGATGAQGPAGAAGAKGETGAAGAAGAAGETGLQGIQGEKGQRGKGGEEGLEGLEGKEGKEGKEGSPWTPGFLPAEKTEEGTWALVLGTACKEACNGRAYGYSPISFTVPLEKAIEASTVEPAYYEGTAGDECPGKAEEPKAAAGHLCVYAIVETEAAAPTIAPESDTAAGVVLRVRLEEKFAGGSAYGTWAVTAPPAA